ncbi:hypothetical protein [Caenibacillus caldisaponilyticus]|jgi:hypothetical protein|nr:hypothetical protein [Caenibacillus caldisaponilyticus]
MKRLKGVVLTVLAATFLSTSLYAVTAFTASKVSSEREGLTSDSIRLNTF